jgi:peroxiredoxin
MTSLPSSDTLVFYRRDGCSVCDEARLSLQQVLEDRVKRGDAAPRVRYVDIDADADLVDRYGAFVPVIALADQELALSSSYRQIATFLDCAIGRRA